VDLLLDRCVFVFAMIPSRRRLAITGPIALESVVVEAVVVKTRQMSSVVSVG